MLVCLKNLNLRLRRCTQSKDRMSRQWFEGPPGVQQKIGSGTFRYNESHGKERVVATSAPLNPTIPIQMAESLSVIDGKKPT